MFKSDRRNGFATILFVGGLFVTSNLAAQEVIDYQGLTPSKGIELVLENCTVCHSSDIILANHMGREAWDKTITWMQKVQGMWELDESDRETILSYLSKTQGIGINHAEPNVKKSNPMYEFDYRPNPL